MLCTLIHDNGTIRLFPWNSGSAPSVPSEVNAFGVDPQPCITARHSGGASSLITGIMAMPVSRLISAAPSDTVWQPVPFPFLMIYQSSVVIRDVVVTGFGVLTPKAPEWGPLSVASVRLRGGCIGSYASSVEVSRTTISACVAEEGAGFYALNGDFTLLESVIRDNVAIHRGGGISLSGVTTRIVSSELVNNSVLSISALPNTLGIPELASPAGGGALYCFGMLATPLKLQNVQVVRNTVDTRRTVSRDIGGGLAFSSCLFFMNNVTLLNNRVGPALFQEGAWEPVATGSKPSILPMLHGVVFLHHKAVEVFTIPRLWATSLECQAELQVSSSAVSCL